MKKYQTGLIFGKFFPLHPGHILMIEEALRSVDQLYVFMCSDTRRDQMLFDQSKMIKLPTRHDRLRWFTPLTNQYDSLHIVDFNEDGIPSYPNGWLEWSNRVKSTLNDLAITPDIVFSSEPQDAPLYMRYFNLPVKLFDPNRENINISATRLREDPEQHKAYLLDDVYPYFFE